MRYDNLTITPNEFAELWNVLCDETPTEGQWVWPMDALCAVPELGAYSHSYRRDKVVAFRNKIRGQAGHHIVKRGSKYEWVFDQI
jgi:hypothetical protein